MGLVAAEKFDGMDAKEFEQMLHHYQKRADPAAEKKWKTVGTDQKAEEKSSAFCFVGLSYKATTSFAGGDKNL